MGKRILMAAILTLALSAGAANDRLAISFSIWALYDMVPGGTFADPAKTMEGLKERGYNAIRLDDGAGLYAAPDGTPRGKVRIHPMFGEYSRKIRQQPVSEVREMDMRENLVRFCRAADACGMKVILSSWYYLHTNWMTDESINAQLFEGLSDERKMEYFTDELCRILTILRENKLDRCVAFVELFNEFDGLFFTGDYGKIKDRTKVEHLRSLHEASIARLKREHPGVRVAYDVWTPRTQKGLVPRNADVLSFHHYYYWDVYRDFEQGAVRKTVEEIPIPDGVRPYLVATPPTIADITATRRGNLRVGNDWNPRVRLYAALDETKIPAIERRLSDAFEKNRPSYLQALRDGIAQIGKIRDEVLPGAALVMGEGGSYCAANALQFEEHSDSFWAMLREQSKILREEGVWGTVPRTLSGPEDPSWEMRPHDLRRVNDLFRLGEGKKSDCAGTPYRIDVAPGESLTAVRDRVRALDAARRANGVEVVIPSGTYALPQALTLGAEDSGTKGAPVVWRAADPKNRPQLVGGDAIPASAFRPVADPELVARLDPEARGKVLETDISGIRFAWPKPQKIPCELWPPLKVPDVFAGGQRLALASFPAEGWSEIVKITDRGAGYGDRSLASALAQGVIRPEDIYGGTFVYREDRPSRWAAHPEVAIEGFWRFDWRNTIIYAKSIDPQAKTITLGAAHSYRLGQGNPAPRRWRALNVFEELNRPGRYTVDFAKRRLYVYPPAGFDGVGICSAADPLVRMKGAHDIELRGFRFGRSSGSGLVLERTTDVTVYRCEFTDIRQVAVRGEGCRRCMVRTCDFHRLCGGGISLSGGNRRTLEPGRNLVVDCLFHDWNRLSATAMAVSVGGVGNAVRHCVMRDTSHQAAGLVGNDCRFEYNVVSNACTGTDDAGAFYKGRNPSAQGNVLRYNYFRNIGRQEVQNGHGSSAVYFDDGDCGETVFGNVFENAGIAGFGNFAAVFSHGGHSNVVRNCIFLDCQRALGSGPWPQKRWAEFLQSDKDAFPIVTRLRKEVDITQPPYTTHYPCLVGFLDPQPDEYRWNAAYDNAYVNCPLSLPDAQGKLTKPGLVAGRWFTNETSVVIKGDPGFVNRAAGDLRLRDDSQIYRKIPGFQPIPFEKIGLLTPEGCR